MRNASGALAALISRALRELRLPAAQLEGQLPGAQVAPAGPGSPGVVAAEDLSAPVEDHEAADDPHPQYLTAAEGAAAFEPLGAAASAVAAHAAAGDPHPQYLTQAEGDARYPIATTARSAGQVWAGPVAGPAAAPAWRALAPRDMPGGVAARFGTGAGPSIAHNTTTLVDFNTLFVDTLGWVTTGSGWRFTAVDAGNYLVAAAVMFVNTTAWADGEVGLLSVYRNGSVYAHLDRKDTYGSAASVYMQLSGAMLVILAEGDYIDVRVLQTSGGALTLFASAAYNHVSIVRV